MDPLRVIVKWLESVDAAPPGLRSKIRSPTLTDVRNVMLEEEDSDEFIAYLLRVRCTTRARSAILMWHSLLRVGALRALNLSEFNPEELSMKVVHRAETGTPIKNGEAGERYVALSQHLQSDRRLERRPTTHHV